MVGAPMVAADDKPAALAVPDWAWLVPDPMRHATRPPAAAPQARGFERGFWLSRHNGWDTGRLREA
jgi:hypothetical protein